MISRPALPPEPRRATRGSSRAPQDAAASPGGSTQRCDRPCSLHTQRGSRQVLSPRVATRSLVSLVSLVSLISLISPISPISLLLHPGEELEPALGAPRSSPIASISLGAARRFGYPSWSKWPPWRGHSWPPRAPQSASEGLGLPSALVRRGPASQTPPRGRGLPA